MYRFINRNIFTDQISRLNLTLYPHDARSLKNPITHPLTNRRSNDEDHMFVGVCARCDRIWKRACSITEQNKKKLVKYKSSRSTDDNFAFQKVIAIHVYFVLSWFPLMSHQTSNDRYLRQLISNRLIYNLTLLEYVSPFFFLRNSTALNCWNKMLSLFFWLLNQIVNE